jgi:NAD(P)H-dependent FMN reductase
MEIDFGDGALAMRRKVLLFYGSYREPRNGIRLVKYLLARMPARGIDVDFIDARETGLPMLNRMYKEYPKGAAPEAMETLAQKIKAADGFVFVCGEYNWGVQPGLKNLTDHFLEEWYWRPAAIVSYSLQQTGGARAAYNWHATLGEMGMIVVSSTIAVSPITEALNDNGEPTGPSGAYLEKKFPRLIDDLSWWMEAAGAQRTRQAPPY